jgi:hypothetical protein
VHDFGARDMARHFLDTLKDNGSSNGQLPTRAVNRALTVMEMT